MVILHPRLRGLTDGLREGLISPCRDKSDRDTQRCSHTALWSSRERDRGIWTEKPHTVSSPDCLFKTCFKSLCSAPPALQEWAADGYGLRGCLEWAGWSPWSLLLWQFPDNLRQKSCLPRTWPSFSLTLTNLWVFTSLGNILTPTHIHFFCGINKSPAGKQQSDL